MPWIGGAPVEFRGRRFLDGGLAESIPYRSAIGLGATHVLVLQTRPWGVAFEPASRLADRIISRRLSRLNPALLGMYRRRADDYERAVGEIAAGTSEPPADGPFLFGCAYPRAPNQSGGSSDGQSGCRAPGTQPANMPSACGAQRSTQQQAEDRFRPAGVRLLAGDAVQVDVGLDDAHDRVCDVVRVSREIERSAPRLLVEQAFTAPIKRG